MSRATWDKVQIFGYVDDQANIRLKGAPPKSWLQKKWEEILPWLAFTSGLFFGILLGVSWN